MSQEIMSEFDREKADRLKQGKVSLAIKRDDIMRILEDWYMSIVSTGDPHQTVVAENNLMARYAAYRGELSVFEKEGGIL